MNESLRDVVDLSTVVGTVSTALLTCNSPNYTNNKNTLVNISQVFTSSSSTTTAIKDTMILFHLKKHIFFFFLHINIFLKYYQRYFVESFMITKIFCGFICSIYIFFVDLSCMVFHLWQPVKTTWYTIQYLSKFCYFYVPKLYNSEKSNFTPPPHPPCKNFH